MNLPWHKIGKPEGQSGTLPALRDHYGSEWFAISKYFLPTQKLASSIDCPNPGGPGCPRQVVVHSHDDIVAVCGNSPRECEIVKLSRHDVIIHELKIEKLLSDFARVFHVRGAEPEKVMPLTWNLGTYAEKGRPALSVYISLETDPTEFQHVAITLLAQKGKLFILLAASRSVCPWILAESIQNSGAYLLEMAALQDFEEVQGRVGALGKLTFDNSEEIRPQQENYFRLEKDYWQVLFQGKRWAIKQSVGMQYIVELIQRAYNNEPEIHVTELFYVVKGRPPLQDTPYSKLSREQLLELGVDVTISGDGLDLMTPDGKEWAKKQRRHLVEQIEDAKEFGRQDQALRLRKVLEEFEDYCRKAYGLSGRTRKESDTNEKIRKSVSKAIENTLVKMGKKKGDELAIYLDDHLNTGISCSFRKDPNISWKIMKK